MNVYKMNEEEIEKLASDFNNTVIGKRIWLFSMMPQVVGFLALMLYLILMLYGISNPLVKDVIVNYIMADIVVLGLALILYGLAKMFYWKEVINYGNELSKIEAMKKELEVKVKKTKDKVTKDIKKKTTNVKKAVKAVKDKK